MSALFVIKIIFRLTRLTTVLSWKKDILIASVKLAFRGGLQFFEGWPSIY